VRIDLHLHSNVSDGHLAPAELVAAAALAGLSVISLTDHDTIGGVPDAVAAGSTLGVQVIPGIEVSTRTGEHEYHILGYWVDPLHPTMLEHQKIALARREHRMHGMVEKLRTLGMDISFDDVVRAAGPDVQALGRPHLARAMLDAGLTRYYGEAFARYIADGGIAYVSERFPEVEQAIELIHAVGGMAVWAHPDPDRFAADIHAFRAAGLDGVECYRPHLTHDETRALLRRVSELGLHPTGGSDWHGPARSQLGDFSVSREEVQGVLDWPAVVRPAHQAH
jgi:3',5'-nucleoside bisphosphate phosphatase